jgi:hypothetical protein
MSAPNASVQLEELGQFKSFMTVSGIKPMTFCGVA